MNRGQQNRTNNSNYEMRKENAMSRTITNNDLKNKRDLSAWRIELNGYDMSETNAKHESAVKELAEREEKRIGKLKDTLFRLMEDEE